MKPIHRVNVNTIKIPIIFFSDLQKSTTTDLETQKTINKVFWAKIITI